MASTPGRKAMTEPTYRVRHCTMCGENWANLDDFAECGKCHEPTAIVDLRKHFAVDRAPTPGESRSLAQYYRELERQEFAQAEAERKARGESPMANAAVAALNYDLEQWLAVPQDELEAWAEGS